MMDFCFERLFNKKDKEFMLAYQKHIQDIQSDLEKMK